MLYNNKHTNMKYFFKPDGLVVIISLIVIITMAMALSIIPWTSIGSIILYILIVGSLVYALAVMPLWLKVDNESIRVQQLIGHKKFNKKDIEIYSIEKSDIGGSIRVFGSGGYGGYTGWFRNKKLGKYFMLVVNTKELALIKTKKGKQLVINYPESLRSELKPLGN